MSETTGSHPKYGALIDYANEQERNHKLRSGLEDAESPIISRLTNAALDASTQKLNQMTSDPEFADSLIAAHAELCFEIGRRVLSSDEWQQANRLQASSADLIPAEAFQDARTTIADAITQTTLTELTAIPEEVIEQLYNEEMCTKLDRPPKNNQGSTSNQRPQTETEPFEADQDKPTRRREAYMTVDYEAETLTIGRRSSRQRELAIAKDRGSQKVVDRARLLVALSENRGKELGVYELWEEAFGDRAFNSREMNLHRQWLNRVTYNNQPIVRHNGERNPHSAYKISNINLHVNHENIHPVELYPRTTDTTAVDTSATNEEPDTEPIQATDQSTTIIKAIEHDIPDTSKSEADQWRDIMHQVKKIIEAKDEPEVHYGYLYSLAIAIHNRVDFLDTLGVPLPTKNLVQAIEEYAEANDINININPKQLQQRQEEEKIEPLTMCRMRALIDLVTKDELMEYVDQYGADHPVVALLDYVTSLDNEQTDRLTDVISGTIIGVREEQFVGGIRRIGHEVQHKGAILVLPNGDTIESNSTTLEPEADEDEVAGDKPDRITVTTVEAHAATTTINLNDEPALPIATEANTDAPAPAKRERKLSKLDEFKNNVSNIIEEEIIPALEAIGVSDITDDSQSVSRAQLQSQFASISRSHVKNLAENGHISRSNANNGLSIKDAIMTILFANSNIKEQLSNKRYRKAAESVISDQIERVRVS